MVLEQKMASRPCPFGREVSSVNLYLTKLQQEVDEGNLWKGIFRGMFFLFTYDDQKEKVKTKKFKS